MEEPLGDKDPKYVIKECATEKNCPDLSGSRKHVMLCELANDQQQDDNC